MADIASADDGLRELALFAGAGGGILGGHLLGWRTICAVEWEPYAASVLAARQNDGLLPPFPIWDDVRTFDGRPWRGIVDVVSGGFPCQDISVAGKGDGLDGERSGLWSEMARIVGEVRPGYVFVENSPALTSRGLSRVLGDLASLGYDARWGVVSAADAGAPHRRERIWIVAYSNEIGRDGRTRQQWESRGIESKDGRNGLAYAREFGHRHPENEVRARRDAAFNGGSPMADTNGLREPQSEGGECDERRRAGNGREEVADAECIGQSGPRQHERSGDSKAHCYGETDRLVYGSQRWPGDWKSEPDVGRVANGVAARMDRLKALGNGQVPQCAALAWNILNGKDRNA